LCIGDAAEIPTKRIRKQKADGQDAQSLWRYRGGLRTVYSVTQLSDRLERRPAVALLLAMGSIHSSDCSNAASGKRFRACLSSLGLSL